MRKGNKRVEKAASVSDSSSDDESVVKNKKARNGAGKKDGANDSDSENEKNHKNGDDNDKKAPSKSRQSEKKSHEQKDDKKKRKNQSKEQSDQSNESASEEETLSKIAKTSKKSDTSSTKGKDKEPSADRDEPTVEDSEEEYEVEEIISHKKSHGRILYLIRWKGFGSDSDTWETSATIENCPDVLKKYSDEHPDSLPTPSSNKSSKSKKEKSHKKQKEIVSEEVDETKDYEVEKIIDVFFKKDKSREFLIRWKGYQSTSDSWEPEEALNCADLIEKFMAKVDQAKNFVEKELRTNRKHTERFTLRTQENERRLSKRYDGKQRAVYYDAEE